MQRFIRQIQYNGLAENTVSDKGIEETSEQNSQAKEKQEYLLNLACQ